MAEPVRLSKYLAHTLPCSRREAELYIEGGWVLVDGVVVEEPQFKVAGQSVSLNPEATLAPQPPVTILLHKPSGWPATATEHVAAANHWAEDASGQRLLKRHFQRLGCCMPLDDADCGLQVYTHDRHVARKLTEDADLLEQEIIVEVEGALSVELVARLNKAGRELCRPVQGIKISQQSERRLRFALKDPQPGQLRQVCESVGLRVLGMKRIRIGSIPMAGLPEGQWRYLAPGTRF